MNFEQDSNSRRPVLVIGSVATRADEFQRSLDESGIASDAAWSMVAAEKRMREKLYDVVLLEIDAATRIVPELVLRLLCIHPTSRIVVVTYDVTLLHLLELIERGACDVILAHEPMNMVAASVRIAVDQTMRWRRARRGSPEAV